MSAIFLSDVHLRDSHGPKAQLILRFFREIVQRHERLFILGDLFDVWPGTDRFLWDRFEPILNALGELYRSGCEIHYIEGNHDFCLGAELAHRIGLRLYERECQIVLGTHRLLLVHGDLENSTEIGYPVLRRILRSRPVQWTRLVLPGSWVFKAGCNTSTLSRAYQRVPSTEREEEIKKIYRASARKYFNSGYDFVVMGHTHIPDDYKIDISGRECRYINLGDWVRNFTYLEFDGQEFYTKKHPMVALLQNG